MAVRLIRRDKIAVLNFSGEGVNAWGTRLAEHRFDRVFLKDLSSALTQVESEMSSFEGLVMTGEGRFFSNGFDLNFLKTVSHGEAVDMQIYWEKII